MRDARWGRNQEVSGEDPFLASEIAFAFVKNLQKEGDEKHLKAVATPKHFLAYDLEGVRGRYGGQACTCTLTNKSDCSHDAVVAQCNHSRFNFDARVSHQDLVAFYLPSWEGAIKRGNAHSVMCSFNAVNGQPACSNGLIENGILRGEYGFDGFIVTDCGAVEHLRDDYFVDGAGTSWAQAAAAALNNGTDLGSSKLGA